MITAHAGRSRSTGRATCKILNHTPRPFTQRTPESADAHSWQYHYLRDLALELCQNDESRASDLFHRWEAQARSELARLMKKGNGQRLSLTTQLVKIAQKHQEIIERIMHMAPSKGDTSRDIEPSEYDGTEVTLEDIARERESTEFLKYTDGKVIDRGAWYITISPFGPIIVECKKRDVARGRRVNGTGSRGNRDSHRGYIWQLAK